ncbi:hypothetical protein AVEN_238512-1 [Araneus ventricosus]|uniref:Mos1 transposase HTH domain-containing protein n=1 Tax=Araneus ventricosus TaxID=182803 RepID=A0A4Y2LN45_ARAVE|nr:hypothetical protein AVEN_238512-1 [Araneus ventricosus]
MRKLDMGAVRWCCCRCVNCKNKTVDPVRRVVAVRCCSGECHFYRFKACLQKVISGRGLKSRLLVAKMHLNVITDYARPVSCALSYRTVVRWVKAFRAGRNESVDLHCTGRQSIPQHQIEILSGLLSIDGLWIARELSAEVGLSHQTVWHIMKKWRILRRSVALISKQHLASGILRLSDIWQKIQTKLCW